MTKCQCISKVNWNPSPYENCWRYILTTNWRDNDERANVERVSTVRPNVVVVAAYLHDSSAATLLFLCRRVGAAVVAVATRWGGAMGRAPDDNNNNNGTDGTARFVVPGRNDETLYGDVPVHVLRATKVAVQRCPNPLLPRLLTGRTLLGASYAYCTVRLRGTRSAAVTACPTRSHVRIPATIAVSTITSSTNCRTCWFTRPLFTHWRT